MSKPINWCDLKKNIKHIGEVSTSHQNGEPTGAEILTSTNEVTGQVRDTLEGKLKKMQVQFDERFQTLAPIEWKPNTEVTNGLQVYFHISDGVERTYLPDPAQMPFTTEATFADDAALNRWVADDVLTRMINWRDVGDVRGWGAFPSSTVDNWRNIQDAIDDSLYVKFPEGLFLISKALKTRVGTSITGEGLVATRIKAMDDCEVISIIDARDQHYLTLRDIGLDGNKLNRPAVRQGNGVLYNANNALFERCSFINNPNSGVLFNGIENATSNNIVRDCVISNNDGVGISQHTSRNNVITGNRFQNNGLENLTIDNNSHGCTVSDNRFYKHRGGCGCIGWDQSNETRVVGNWFDGEGATDAAEGARTAITINSMAGPTDNFIIQGNSIKGYQDFGINLQDRRVEGGYQAGSGIITGNTITACAKGSIRVTDTSHTVLIDNNKTDDGLVLLTSGNQLKLGAGDVAWSCNLPKNLTLTADDDWIPITSFELVSARNVFLEGGTVRLPTGGVYAVYGKARFIKIPSTVHTISLSLLEVSGNWKHDLINYSMPDGVTVAEISFSPVIFLRSHGKLILEVRAIGEGGETVTIEAGYNTELNGTYIG